DLRGELHPFTLTLALASGAPWLGGHVEPFEPGADEDAGESMVPVDASGKVVLLTTRATLSLWAAGRVARPTRFEGVRDGDRLVLPDGPSLVLRLAREVPLPEAPLALAVRAERTKPAEVAHETYDAFDLPDTRVGADGLVRVVVPWPGEYELAWSVRHS